MLKRTVFASIAALALCSPALAIEIPADAGVGFVKESTAYPSTSFNKLLEACGTTMSADAVGNVPATYAKAGDGSVVFNDLDIAYSPMQYHSIFTAYGLQINPDKVKESAVADYAVVKDGEVVVKAAPSIAFNGDEWTRIFAMYDLPVVDGDDDGDGVLNSRDRCPDTPKGVKVDEDGCWVYTGVLFDFDKSTLKSQYKEDLKGAKEVFDMNPDLEVVVEGHADAIGSDAYNQKLSERRANAVVKYLVNTVGVPADKLTAVGYGESRPVATNDTAEGRAQNRRVEFTPNRK